MQNLGTTCEEGSVRLVGGYSRKEGRVQICNEGKWTSVCADSWSENDIEAKVVCSQLGYSMKSGKLHLEK